MEQRARERFAADLSSYAQRRAFTEQLVKQREQLSDDERKRFDDEVTRYMQLHAWTQRMQDERDLREALAFVREFALQEKKRAFTQRLMAERQR